MRPSFRFASTLVLASLIALAVPCALASGSDSAPKKDEAAGDPEEQAIKLFNKGLGHNDTARKLETKLHGMSAGSKRDKTVEQIAAEYKTAIPLFNEATKLNPGMYQAFNEIGYAQRKSGNYDKALEAYDKALTLEPRYGAAIEYRAEAYLGLNRVDEAKTAYETLLDIDVGYAKELLGAMRHWVSARRANPGGVSSKTLSDVERWVEQRTAAAGDKVGHNVPPATRDW